MADEKISDMTPATVLLDGTELVPLVQGGVNVKATVLSVLKSSALGRGAFYDTTDQTALADTATAMTLDTAAASNVGVSVVANSQITLVNPGTYNVQFSAQLVNTDSSEHTVTIWLRVDGSDVDSSASDITVPKKQAGIDGAAIAAWNFFVDVTAGQYVELMWSTPNTGVTIADIPARITPTRPAVPSLIVTVTQVA